MTISSCSNEDGHLKYVRGFPTIDHPLRGFPSIDHPMFYVPMCCSKTTPGPASEVKASHRLSRASTAGELETDPVHSVQKAHVAGPHTGSRVIEDLVVLGVKAW